MPLIRSFASAKERICITRVKDWKSAPFWACGQAELTQLESSLSRPLPLIHAQLFFIDAPPACDIGVFAFWRWAVHNGQMMLFSWHNVITDNPFHFVSSVPESSGLLCPNPFASKI